MNLAIGLLICLGAAASASPRRPHILVVRKVVPYYGPISQLEQPEIPQETYSPHHQPAPLHSDGTVAETPEVQAAKAKHLAAYMKALETYDPSWVEEDQQQYQYRAVHQPQQVAYRAPANNQQQVGRLHHVDVEAHYSAEELAVKRAKAAFAEAYVEAAKNYRKRIYKRSPAPLNHDLTVDDTAEVKAAKAALAEAYQNALLRNKHAEAYNYYKRYEPAPLNHDRTVDETEEVKHAKIAHMEAFHKALARTTGMEQKMEEQMTPEMKEEMMKEEMKQEEMLDENAEVKAAKDALIAAIEKALERCRQQKMEVMMKMEMENRKAQENGHNFYYYQRRVAPAAMTEEQAMSEAEEAAKTAEMSAFEKELAHATNSLAEPKVQHRFYTQNYYNKNYYSKNYYNQHSRQFHYASKNQQAMAEEQAMKEEAAMAEPAHGSHAMVIFGMQEKEAMDEAMKGAEEAPLNEDGTVADTAEVKTAKAAHASAYMKELAHADLSWMEPGMEHAHRVQRMPTRYYVYERH